MRPVNQIEEAVAPSEQSFTPPPNGNVP